MVETLEFRKFRSCSLYECWFFLQLRFSFLDYELPDLQIMWWEKLIYICIYIYNTGQRTDVNEKDRNRSLHLKVMYTFQKVRSRWFRVSWIGEDIQIKCLFSVFAYETFKRLCTLIKTCDTSIQIYFDSFDESFCKRPYWTIHGHLASYKVTKTFPSTTT